MRIHDPDASTEKKAEIAKAALCEMKSATRTLAAMLSSLEDTIELVTVESSRFIQSVGFSSLPDDLLARIFEICATSNDPDDFKSYLSGLAVDLSRVCRRFRRIVTHVPCLWEDVSNLAVRNWVLDVQDRCPSPFVHISVSNILAEHRVRNLQDFLQLLHPPNRWKGLSLSFDRRTSIAHDFLKLMTTTSGGDFSSIKTLSLRLDWEQERVYKLRGTRNKIPTTMILYPTAALLYTWNLDSLTELMVKDCIPNRMKFPNLRKCSIQLMRAIDPFVWDLQALKNFFCSIHVVESLSITLNLRFCSIGSKKVNSKPTKFSRLTSLVVNVFTASDELMAFGFLMDGIDAEALSTLKICLSGSESDDDKLRSWFDAILLHKSPLRRRPRFPNVTSFNLHFVGGGNTQSYLPCGSIFGAVPQVKHLSLDLPEDQYFVLETAFEFCKDIRTIRLATIRSTKTLQFLVDLLDKRLKDNDENILDRLEIFEIEGFDAVSSYKKQMETILRGKFIWSPGGGGIRRLLDNTRGRSNVCATQ